MCVKVLFYQKYSLVNFTQPLLFKLKDLIVFTNTHKISLCLMADFLFMFPIIAYTRIKTIILALFSCNVSSHPDVIIIENKLAREEGVYAYA